MSNTKTQIKEIKEIKPQKTFKDSFTNTSYKRPFVLEKIEKDIHKKNFIEYMNNKNQSPLMNKRKQLKKIKLPYKIKISPKKEKEELINNNKALFIHCIPNVEHLKLQMNQKKINLIPKKRLIRQRSDFDLPMIAKHKLKNQSQIHEKTTMTFFEDKKNNKTIDDNKEEEKKDQENIAESGMMGAKDLYKNKSRKITICTFLNKMPGDKSLNENYKVINNANEINDKYNLDLNLPNKNGSNSKIFKGKKYNIYGMLNKLFQYYSSVSNNNNTNYRNNKYMSSINYKNSSSDFDTIENKKINNENSDSGLNTIDIIKDTYEDDSNTFLTKLQNYNISEKKDNEFDVSKLIRKRYSLSELKRSNDEVISNDKRIGIDCLMSKVQKEINIKKILYKYIDKTLYVFEDDPAYKRIKEFEKKLIKILKNKY